MTQADYYAVLGVSPDAEDIVIKAAYRALAQRYHPDKNIADPAFSRKRMAEINEAYQVLGDPKLRNAYDLSRSPKSGHGYQKDEPTEQTAAFDAALAEMEGRWSVAVSIYPDLKRLRDSLAHISTSLAFGFVAILLETKEFESRREISKKLESDFLKRFFGSNQEILYFAKRLILVGARDAALELNKIVDIVGFGSAGSVIIDRINIDFNYPLRVKSASLSQTAGDIFDQRISERQRLIKWAGLEANLSWYMYLLIIFIGSLVGLASFSAFDSNSAMLGIGSGAIFGFFIALIVSAVRSDNAKARMNEDLPSA